MELSLIHILLEFLRTDAHRSIEMNAARVIKTITNTPIEVSEEEGEIETVSYTHLDVYKRQSVYSTDEEELYSHTEDCNENTKRVVASYEVYLTAGSVT